MSAVELPARVDGYPTRRIHGYDVRPGRPLPFGVTPVPGGLNFAVHSRRATGVALVLFRRGEREPLVTLPFPDSFRVGDVYAMTVFGLDPEAVDYGYRVEGPFDPARGDRFDVGALLVDPYARLLVGRETWGVGPDGSRPGDPGEREPWRSRPVYDDFDWEDDRPPGRAPEDLVVYEAHVRGFTRSPSSGVRHRGTYAGLVEKIPYLQELGVNCLELMPVFEFDEFENSSLDRESGRRRLNYWGYSTVGFFAPKVGYAASGPAGMAVDEMKNLVKQMHRAGIEVVLDVVLNHTAEGNDAGPTISFRGLDNATWYLLGPAGEYANYSGTGNTVNCNDPVVRGFILDCLRYWVSEYHVDGFRFDLASILGRGPDGVPLAAPPVLEALAHDPLLRGRTLIAEAWDAAGLYQVGSFPGYARFSEWNGRYRDALRRFLKGDPGQAGEMATRFVGSPDLYARRPATTSVNFVTSHDGFTLADLVSYNDKHNGANGEDGRDGDDANHSWNCGHEGPTDDPEILELRRRQMCNALLLLLTSHGIPMLTAGDEVGRSQQGNNNAYGHDGPLSWFDWTLTDTNAELFEVTRRAIAFRRAHPALRRRFHPSGPDGVSWHGEQVLAPDWSPDSRRFAVLLHQDDDRVYLVANAHWQPVTLDLPALPDPLAWHRFADTAATGARTHEPGHEPVLADQGSIRAAGRSVVVLTAGPSRPPTRHP